MSKQTDLINIPDAITVSGSNVGIGTSSPAYKLDVNGSLSSNGSENVMRIAAADSTQAGGINIHSIYGNSANERVTTFFSIDGQNQASPLAFGTGSTERMRIDSSGNVGIGTVDPNAGIQVAKGSTGTPAKGADTGCAVFGNTTSANAYGLVVGANATGTGYIQAQRTDGGQATYDLHLQPNGGNVGIGTSSPAYKLETKNGDISTIKLISAAGGNAVNGIRFRVHNSANTAQSATLGMVNAETVSAWGGVLTFSTKPANGTPNESVTERMRIDSSGRVTTPYQPAFLAHGNSGTYYSVSSLGNGSYIPFANAVTNIGNCFNPSNSRFSAPVAGMYHFDVAVYTRTGSATEDIYPRFRVNNSSNKGYTYWYNTTGSEVHHTITDSINIYLNAGDDLGITINGNANSDIYLGFQETRFSGYLLG